MGQLSKQFVRALAVFIAWNSTMANAEERARIRDLGIAPGILSPGPHNAITDVAGVRVGHTTIVRGDDIRTGVTAVIPHGGNLYQRKTPAGVYVANAFGKAAGLLQVDELGTLETPIVLTNTLNVGTAIEAVVSWTLAQPGNENVRSVNAVVGETNDGYLNDIRGLHVTRNDVIAAIDGAKAGPVAEGAVGAGTGTVCFGWKGGIGTASRVLPERSGGFTVGALVQSNFGGVLTIDGLPVGEWLGNLPLGLSAAAGGGEAGASPPTDGGSIIIILATDAPLSHTQLTRLARRAPLALGRVGSYMSHGSGDFVVAFSTHLPPAPDAHGLIAPQVLSDEKLDPIFLGAVEAIEEAIYNSLTMAETTTGFQGRRVDGLPLDRLREFAAERTRRP